LYTILYLCLEDYIKIKKHFYYISYKQKKWPRVDNYWSTNDCSFSTIILINIFSCSDQIDLTKQKSKRVKLVFRCILVHHLASILSTFYVQIFRTNVCFGSFYNIHVTRKKLPKWRSYEESAHFTLMKLTPSNFFYEEL